MNPPVSSIEHACVPSPCVGVCRMDAADRWCVGCLRSRDEIGDWGRMSDCEKLTLWTQLAQRGENPPTPPPASVPDA